MKLLEKWNKTDAASRITLRFFAGMLLLTLLARGTTGAAMARVKQEKPSRGTICQNASAAAELIAEEGEALLLPAGVPVEKLWVTAEQQVHQGDALVQLDKVSLQELQAQTEVQLAQEKTRLAQLNAPTQLEDSGVTAAQKRLTQTTEDAVRAEKQASEAVEKAQTQQRSAQAEYENAVAAREALDQQTDPAPTEEAYAAAESAIQTAKEALDGAMESLSAAKTAQEEVQIANRQQKEQAQTDLDAAKADYTKAQAENALTQQSSQAEAAAVQLEIQKLEQQITQLTALQQVDGFVTAPRDTQILRCDLQEGQPCPEWMPLVLAKEESVLLVQFSLPEETAEKVKPGQKVQVQQEKQETSALVQTVTKPDAEGQCQITAVLSQQEEIVWDRNAPVNVELEFSRTEYPTCVSVSAIRQDGEGTFVLGVETEKTVFGVTNTAVRVPVTVLEIDSNGMYAAVEGGLPESIIAEADRAVKPGASVRLAP